MAESRVGNVAATDSAWPASAEVTWSSAQHAYVESSTGRPVGGSRPTGLRQLLLRASVAVLVFAGLQIGWELMRGGAVEHVLIHEGTVRPAAALIRALTPDVHAQAVRFSVKAPGGGLNIRNGCEGTEGLFLLVAAFVVAPLGWRSRACGLAAGVAVLYLLNQVRVVALFYAWRADHGLFELLHGTVTPVAIVLIVAGYYHAWLSAAQRRLA